MYQATEYNLMLNGTFVAPQLFKKRQKHLSRRLDGNHSSKLTKCQREGEKERKLSQFCVRRRVQLLIETLLDHRGMLRR
jgi:hypothetical protein